MPTATVEIQLDVPAGVTIGEYERIENGHSFHVSWELPAVCRCETCKRETPLQLIEKAKFLVIRDLGNPAFQVFSLTPGRVFEFFGIGGGASLGYAHVCSCGSDTLVRQILLQVRQNTATGAVPSGTHLAAFFLLHSRASKREAFPCQIQPFLAATFK